MVKNYNVELSFNETIDLMTLLDVRYDLLCERLNNAELSIMQDEIKAEMKRNRSLWNKLRRA